MTLHFLHMQESVDTQLVSRRVFQGSAVKVQQQFDTYSISACKHLADFSPVNHSIKHLVVLSSVRGAADLLFKDEEYNMSCCSELFPD